MSECTQCLMNSTVDSHIHYNIKGICNYCSEYARLQNSFTIDNTYFQKQIISIKNQKRSSPYHCILGVSGGTDSSYVAYLLHDAGLNVLMVNCDNGWNTAVADENLQKIKNKTGFDLISRKVDAKAFFSMQRSFLKARVIDIELLSDHVNISSIYELAMKKNIPWIVTGENINTEYFMPSTWIHNKNDLRQIKHINQKFEKADLSSFPTLGPYRKFFIKNKLNVKYFKPLNYINYDKTKATEILKSVFDWKEHGGKHFESVFTIFYQCYILPNFFNVDKRIVHLSNLICSKLMTKAEAIEAMKAPILEKEFCAQLKTKVLSRLGMTDLEFQTIMAKPIAQHADYRSHLVYNSSIQKVVKLFR